MFCDNHGVLELRKNQVRDVQSCEVLLSLEIKKALARFTVETFFKFNGTELRVKRSNHDSTLSQLVKTKAMTIVEPF